MRSRVILIALALGAAAFLPEMNASVVAANGYGNLAMVDDCDPNADWGVGGCLLAEGSVTRAQFVALLASPLSPTTVVGHPSWRMDPGYLTIEPGDNLKVRNRGGRNHTFTKVAQFGGGTVPQLRMGLTPAPECATALMVGPDGKVEIPNTDLAAGDNRFMCCFHSWMRAVVKVVPASSGDDKPLK